MLLFQSKPVLQVNAIDATESGAEIINNYIVNHHSLMLEVLLSNIKREAATMYYISAVCSNLYLIEVSHKVICYVLHMFILVRLIRRKSRAFVIARSRPSPSPS